MPRHKPLKKRTEKKDANCQNTTGSKMAYFLVSMLKPFFYPKKKKKCLKPFLQVFQLPALQHYSNLFGIS